MENQEERATYKKYVFMGIIIISLGVTFNVILKESVSSLGTVFIAVGGLFFIIGMSKKKESQKAK